MHQCLALAGRHHPQASTCLSDTCLSATGAPSLSFQDEFSGVITRALSVLVAGMETRLDAELDNMVRMPWATLETVGDQSEYAHVRPVILLPLLPFHFPTVILYPNSPFQASCPSEAAGIPIMS